MLMRAEYATMNYYIFWRAALESARLHQSPACGGTISRTHVYMLAPKTFGTMIRITVSPYPKSTMLAYEIFDTALKFRRTHEEASFDYEHCRTLHGSSR